MTNELKFNDEGMGNLSDFELIELILNDLAFQAKAEKDLGKVKKVTVDWENNRISIEGEKKSFALCISEVLETLRNGGRMLH